MTSNEKRALMKFKEIKEGNAVTIAGTLRITINYACDICNKLCEGGYLERLSPGRFALYKITPSGEELVRGEGEGEKELAEAIGVVEEGKKATELREGVPQSDSEGGKNEEIEEFECTNCGSAVKEDVAVCPKCGVVFEEVIEEGEAVESLDSAQDKLHEEAPSPAPQSPKVDEESVVEESVVEGSDNVGEKQEF